MFAKISVKGRRSGSALFVPDAKETNPEFAGDIKWNFSKFLIDRKGNIVARFEPKVKPDSAEVTAAIEKYLTVK